MAEVVFKEARTTDEVRQVQRLNHRTFAEELGQHGRRPEGELVDRFHERNRYFIAVERGVVIGMISIHARAPFSVERRLPAGLRIGQISEHACEVRLLAIAPEARRGVVLGGLLWRVFAEARRQGWTHMFISAIEERIGMYSALGFRPLGPAVPEGKAQFVPMVLDLRERWLLRKAERFLGWWERRREPAEVRLLPGPVQISDRVKAAFARPLSSHRSPAMIETFSEVRVRLGLLAEGMQVAVMTGSGTLANDAVAACLRSSFGGERGLVLANGEFGERLVGQARRAGLSFTELAAPWGEAWDGKSIARELALGVRWVWCVHVETSTGQVNDLAWLAEICRARGAAVAADCVSSVGAVAIPGESLFLASGVSGKSLGAHADLAFVFASERAIGGIRGEELPSTFDIPRAIRQGEPMFTVASPQLRSLDAALRENYNDAEAVQARLRHYAELGEYVRRELCARGISPIARESAAPAPIISFAVPDERALRRCEEAGFRLAYESEYLRGRGWAQIAVMGDLDEARIAPVFDLLGG